MKLGFSGRTSGSVAARTPVNRGAMRPSAKSRASSAATGNGAAAIKRNDEGAEQVAANQHPSCRQAINNRREQDAGEEVGEEGEAEGQVASAGEPVFS